MKIKKVYPDSLGKKIGIQPGDRLLKINGKRVIDEIDYKFRITEENLIIDMQIGGRIKSIQIEKDYDTDLGVEFEEMKIRSCANDCVFCFVDQNPPDMRKGMYFRDGDYRMSYLYGHYITMTNMGKNELRRVVQQRLSPLYVSVHVTDPKMREKLFLYKKDDKLLKKLEYLTNNGIELHTQIVLIPGLNDQRFMYRTFADLYKYYPMLKTCTLVPVGLTKHRSKLMKLTKVDRYYANKILEESDEMKNHFPGKNSPFILFSDEWYIIADKSLPPLSDYGEIDLIENGVGQVRSFLHQFQKEQQKFPTKLDEPTTVTIVTGKLVCKIFKSNILPVLNKIINLTVKIISVSNMFFGSSVTVSGLLTGKDIVNQLCKYELGDEIWISHRILNEEGTLTLDDMTLKSISKELSCPIKTGNDSFLELLSSLKNG